MGEFEKYFNEHLQDVVIAFDRGDFETTHRLFWKKFEEAKKEFPLKVNQQGIDITLMTTRKFSKDDKKVIQIAEWFVKWFGKDGKGE